MSALDDITHTSPYFSISLYGVREGEELNPEDLRDELHRIHGINVAGDPDAARTVLATGVGEGNGGQRFSYSHYRERRTPGWLGPDTGEEIEDIIQHLLVVVEIDGFVAVYCSDSPVKASLPGRIDNESALDADSVLRKLRRISRRHFSQAFMDGGPTRTLWLGGIHRRTQVKADSKILAGPNLATALNPLDDQTFHFSAARSLADLGTERRLPVGLAPSKSNVWIGPVDNWNHFLNLVGLTVARVRHVEASPDPFEYPLPFLAVPINLDSLAEVGDAFDITLVAPEQIRENLTEDERDRLELLEKWAYEGQFTDISTNQSEGELVIEANALLSEVPYGRVQFRVRPKPQGNAVDYSFRLLEPHEDRTAEEKEEIRKICRRKQWVRIRFETAQTLSDGMFFTVRHRDIPFQGWSFHDFDAPNAFNVKKEKPTPPNNPQRFLPDQIGNQDSLFCWVRNNWYGLTVTNGFGITPGFSLASNHGWLACDDKSMEIADFIFLDEQPDDGGVPIISLIHVKGSKSDTANRGISVSDYEVVCGQAVKNLRLLDGRDLAQGLQDGATNAVATATWHNGNHIGNRTNLISALQTLGSNHRRRVVVVQPRVRQASCQSANTAIGNGTNNAEAQRMRQLNTLLFGVQADCQALGAEFIVISAQ